MFNPDDLTDSIEFDSCIFNESPYKDLYSTARYNFIIGLYEFFAPKHPDENPTSYIGFSEPSADFGDSELNCEELFYHSSPYIGDWDVLYVDIDSSTDYLATDKNVFNALYSSLIGTGV